MHDRDVSCVRVTHLRLRSTSPGGGVCILQSPVTFKPLKSVIVEKLASGEHLAIHGAELCLFADVLLMCGDDRDLVFYQRGGFASFRW